MTAPALETRGLTVGYAGREVMAIGELEVPVGQWWALVGPNGCGKTTVLDSIAGRRVPLRGDVRIAGHSMRTAPRQARAALGLVLPPDALPPRLTLRECLDVFVHAHGRSAPGPEVERLIDLWRLDGRIDDFVDRSSLGTRQKLAVLLALVGDPRLLVLDESFNGLDPVSGQQLQRFLEERVRSGRCAVLLATHALELVEQHADCALLLGDGQIQARLDRSEIDAHRGRLGARLAELAAAHPTGD